jgi:ribosomal protein S18 acetylase RimI-like enzyme
MPDFPSFDHWFPPVVPPERHPAPAYELRHPREDELAALDARLHDWCETRPRGESRRTWVRHFAGTSWVAETGEGRPLGLLLGFRSADRPQEAVVHALAVDPAFRRRGIGRDLVERFASDLGEAGATTVTAACRPDDRIAVAFFVALGFAPLAGPGSTLLYGVPAFADWDGPGEDRALLQRAIEG